MGRELVQIVKGCPRVHNLPLAPASNRKSSFPRYGLPTTFPMILALATLAEV